MEVALAKTSEGFVVINLPEGFEVRYLAENPETKEIVLLCKRPQFDVYDWRFAMRRVEEEGKEVPVPDAYRVFTAMPGEALKQLKVRFFEAFADCAAIGCENEQGELLQIITDPWKLGDDDLPATSPPMDVKGERDIKLNLLPHTVQ